MYKISIVVSEKMHLKIFKMCKNKTWAKYRLILNYEKKFFTACRIILERTMQNFSFLPSKMNFYPL